MNNRWSALIRLSVVASTLLAANAWSTSAWARPVSQSATAAANGTVDIEVVATSVRLLVGKTGQVSVTGELPDDWKLDVAASGSHTRVQVEPSRGKHQRDQTARLDIAVPAGQTVRLRGVSGDVTIDGLDGSLAIAVVSGDVRGTAKGSEIEVKTVSGDIEIKTASSRSTVHTVSGDVKVDGPRGELSIKSVSGDVTVTGASASRARLASTSGELEFGGELTMDGPHEFKSHSGDITLSLRKGKPLDVSVTTHSGKVTNGFAGQTQQQRRGTVQFVVGTGGPKVEIRTFSGDVAIQPR